MAATLSDLNELVKFYANDRTLSITTASELPVVNAVFGWFCTLRRFSELTRIDESLSTTANQETYTWPSSPVFRMEPDPWVEIDDNDNPDDPIPIRRAASEYEWTLHRHAPTGFPEVWRTYSDGTDTLLALRPIPDTTGDAIRIIGQVEPAAFTQGGGESTPFRNENIDRAFAMFLAAEYLLKRRDSQQAQAIRTRANTLLPVHDHAPARSRGAIRPYGIRM